MSMLINFDLLRRKQLLVTSPAKYLSTNSLFLSDGCIYSPDNQERVRHAFNNGHQVASHTWSHKDLNTLSWDQLHDEMWRVELALNRIVGVWPAFMRPPFGNYNNLVREVAGMRDQSVVIWDFDSGDSVGASVGESKSRYDTVVRQHPNTILALNHETYATTATQVIPHAVQKLKAAGYRMVTLAECLGKPAYVNKPKNTATGKWQC
ncbi:hypothetical protein HGRIS_010521 [Hohenbuehelia grisea]|uniref:NodB homology domain-containing protein n=1 Tax=Hohenbuehelia grisea TaxID=104357 RepID=A0ABR3IX63_9AGAR